MLQGERNREKLYAENFTCQHITTTVYSICKVESRLLNFLHVIHSSKTGPSKYLENYAHWSTLEIRKYAMLWNSDALIFFLQPRDVFLDSDISNFTFQNVKTFLLVFFDKLDNFKQKIFTLKNVNFFTFYSNRSLV